MASRISDSLLVVSPNSIGNNGIAEIGSLHVYPTYDDSINYCYINQGNTSNTTKIPNPKFLCSSYGYTSTSNQGYYQVSGKSSAFTYSLPAPVSSAGMVIFLRAASGTLTISGSNIYTANNHSTKTSASESSRSVICFCDGTAWVVMVTNV